VTRLRKMVLEELQRRNYSKSTARAYLRVIRDFAGYFHSSPDKLGPEHVREFQAHLFGDRHLEPGTVVQYSAGLRFLFVKTLHRHFMVDNIPLPKEPFRLPTILSIEEVARLIDSAGNLMHRAILMTLYSTGVRRAELCQLKVSDIDKERMVIHIHAGKGQRDRDVDLSECLLDTLREYWRWMRPKTYLFPGTVNNWRADVPITGKVVWAACREAAVRLVLKNMFTRTCCGIVTPHTGWKPGEICWFSRNCWAMPNSRTQPNTCIFRADIPARSPTRSITFLWRPVLNKPNAPGSRRRDEPTHPRGGRYHP
jgi:integrase/recombinase XerD